RPDDESGSISDGIADTGSAPEGDEGDDGHGIRLDVARVGEVGGTPQEGGEMPDCDSTLELIVRDFNSTHPDMERADPGRDDVGCGMVAPMLHVGGDGARTPDRKSTRLNSSHVKISYAVFCLKK